MLFRSFQKISPKEVKVWVGEGCEQCNFSGYKSRTGIHEFLLMGRAVKDLVLKKASSDDIKRAAVQQGMLTLRQAGWDKVGKKMTTIDEILRVTQVAADEDNTT